MQGQGILHCTWQRIPPDDAYRQMASADFLLLFDPYRRGGSLQLPSKVFEYIQIGRPILSMTTPGAPAEGLLSKSGIPHVCIYHGDSEEQMDGKLERFLSLSSTPATPTLQFLNEFTGRNQTGELARMLNSLLRA